MAKTSFSQIPEGLISSFNRALQSGDRFTFSRFTRKNIFVSRRRKKGLSQKSLLPQISVLWATLDESQKTAWTSAGAVVGITGFKLFTQDMVLRIINEIEGIATPSLLYQTKVGRITLESPATAFKLEQLHPREYWVSRAVRGKKGMREPVLITEDFALPLTLKWSFRTNLISTGAGSFIKFYAIVYSLYQGRTIPNIVSVSCGLQDDWQEASAVISDVLGFARNYALYIEGFNIQGDIFFDNVSAKHSGQNWVRDPFCKDIDQSFTKAFYQVPKNWGVINMPAGAFFGSVYYN
jgi:hypothetical protein